MTRRTLIAHFRNTVIASLLAVLLRAPADALNFSIDLTISDTINSLPPQERVYLRILGGPVQFTQLNDDFATTISADIAGDGIGAGSHLIFLPIDPIFQTDLIPPGDPLFFGIGGLLIAANFGWPSDPVNGFPSDKTGLALEPSRMKRR